MQFRLLGLLQVEDEHGPVRITPGRESAVLALLLIHRGEALPADRVVEELWGDAAPANAKKSVQVYVSRLRKTLGTERIETTAGGYRVRLEPGELDVEQFEQLVEAGRYEQAVQLWAGEPLADFRYAPFAQTEARRLEELHRTAIAARIDERLACGEAPIAELESLIAREPLWERPRGQLMHALYLAGRQADALKLYRRTRDLLAEELGVDPSPELQRLERAILTQDPELGTPARRGRGRTRSRSLMLIVAGALLLTAAAVAAALVAYGGSAAGLKTITAGTVGAIDPRTGRIVAQLATGNRPARLADADGRLWVLNAGDRTVSEVDVARARVVGTFGPNVIPTDVAATNNSVWIASTRVDGSLPDSVARFDAVRRIALGTIALPAARNPTGGRPPEERYLVAGGGRVFAIGPTFEPEEISPDKRTFHTFATSLAYGDGALWAVGGRTVVRIDPRSGATRPIEVPSLFDLGGIAAGGGYVWATSPGEGVVWRIDPRPPNQTTTIPMSYGVSTIAYGDGAAWVGNSYDDSVSRIDPQTRSVTRVATIPAPQDIAVDARRVWVASGSTQGRSGPLLSTACDAPTPADVKGRLIVVSDLDLFASHAPESTIRGLLASHGYRAGRFRLAYQSCDDSTPAAAGYDDGQCVANAATYAADTSVVAVIGTSESACALDEIPILNRAPHGPLAMISPFDTGPFLTRPGSPEAAQTLRQFYAAGPRNFARTIAPDHIQVTADAVLAKRLGLHRIAVVFDNDGMLQQSEAKWFLYAARRLGLHTIPLLWDGREQTSLRTALQSTHPDGAFLVGALLQPDHATSTVATLSATLTRKPVIVTDFFPWNAAAHSSARFYASIAVPQTRAAITLLLRAIGHSNGSRRSIVTQLRKAPELDRLGDPRTAPVAIYRLTADGKRPYTTITPPQADVPPG